MQDNYKEAKVFNFPNGVVRVRKPELTEEEYSRRWKEMYKAAEEVLKEQERNRMEMERKSQVGQRKKEEVQK